MLVHDLLLVKGDEILGPKPDQRLFFRWRKSKKAEVGGSHRGSHAEVAFLLTRDRRDVENETSMRVMQSRPARATEGRGGIIDD
jgi:hypothetical protein